MDVPPGACTSVAEPPDMPRKQRFKPSRKPAAPATEQAQDREEIHAGDVDVETDAPARGMPPDDSVEESGSGHSR